MNMKMRYSRLNNREPLRRFCERIARISQLEAMQAASLQYSVLYAVNGLMKFGDSVTGGHIFRTNLYMRQLLRQMTEDGVYSRETQSWDMNCLLSSVYLHDIGKIAINGAILYKPGSLTYGEFEIMKRHVEVGVRVIGRIMDKTDENEFLRHALLIAGSHHEKWDGSGYPLGLKGEEIPLEGRLMAIADVYDALVSWRTYKTPYETDIARRFIEDGAGTHFDPLLTGVFSRAADKFAGIAREYIAV